MAVDRCDGQRYLVVTRHEMGNELERPRHLVDRGEETTEVPEDEHQPRDNRERRFGRHQEADKDAKHGEREEVAQSKTVSPIHVVVASRTSPKPAPTPSTKMIPGSTTSMLAMTFVATYDHAGSGVTRS